MEERGFNPPCMVFHVALFLEVRTLCTEEIHERSSRWDQKPDVWSSVGETKSMAQKVTITVVHLNRCIDIGEIPNR